MIHTKKLFNLLFEKEDKDKDSPEKPVNLKSGKLKARQSLYSVDSQIDALLLRYESSAIREDDNDILDEISLFNQSLRYLFEQEEDPLEALAGGGDEGGGDEGGGDAATDDEGGETEELGGDSADTSVPTGNEKMDQDTPGKESVPDLDVDEFTNRAVRLITNYDKLLRIEEAIVNRIKNFLDEHYGDEFVIRFMDTLKNEYGIEITEFDEGDMMQTSQDIFAPGANPSATGGGG
mgnify:CR=1 FL=1